MIVKRPEVLVPERQLDPMVLKRLERYARVCYKSEGNLSEDGSDRFIRSKIKLGHESIIEHEKITVMFVIDRGVSHELVRHRIAAYSQESTRYCNYANQKFGEEITVIEPYFYRGTGNYQIWQEACEQIEKAYMALLAAGSSPQEARSILPNSLKTEIVVTFNMREWRHFLALRCDKAAHPQMRQAAIPLLLSLKERLPGLFDDIAYDESFPAEHYAAVTYTDDYFNAI
ncbi:MAG: FAD-dependent thymidylate synthase [Methylocystaceae bacterium]